MPLPAARHTMPDVGAAGDQGSGADACPHPQIGGLFWGGQSEHRQIHPRHVRKVRRGHVREFSEETPATSLARQAHGCRSGQRTVPPRHSSPAIAAQVPRRAHPAVSAAVQPATGANRAGLEVGPPNGHAQPLLCNPRRIAHLSRKMLRPLAKTKFGVV